jgi:hypothetical protein
MSARTIGPGPVTYRGETYISEDDADETTRRWWSDVTDETVTLHDIGSGSTITVSLDDERLTP